jgi:hypothetical protein
MLLTPLVLYIPVRHMQMESRQPTYTQLHVKWFNKEKLQRSSHQILSKASLLSTENRVSRKHINLNKSTEEYRQDRQQ